METEKLKIKKNKQSHGYVDGKSYGFRNALLKNSYETDK